jgi:hypothetical protein
MMPVLREQDFDKMAAHVVDQFLSGKSKLAEAAAKQAMDSGLNPDQIERLAQSANTMTFIRLMENAKQANAEDLTQEFDPIDARQVIKIVIDSTGIHITPPASAHTDSGGQPVEHELPDEMAAERGPVGEGEALEAEGKSEPKEEKKDETPKEAQQRIMRLRKLAGILEDQYKQAEWAFEDTSKKLTDRFRRLYQDISFEDFEKDALAECGDEIGIQVLNAIRVERRLPELDAKIAFEKSAALQDRHVTIETPELALFETLVKIAREAAQLQRGVELVRARCD